MSERKGYIVFHGETPLGGEPVLFLDWDDTIVRPIHGKIFRERNANDWKFTSSNVPSKLNNWPGVIVIVSNQLPIGKNPEWEDGLRKQFESVIQKLRLVKKPWFFGATQKDYIFRKPSRGILDKFIELTNWTVLPDTIYVGDAAGRPGDHSTSDRHFAENSGLKFFTPEEFFLKQSVNLPVEPWCPQDCLVQPIVLPEIPSDIKVLLLQGAPASGKTTIGRRLCEKGWVCISQDELKTLSKCLKAAEQELEQGNRIYIDRTHPSCESRAPFLKLARDYQVLAGAFVFNTPKVVQEHLNHFRAASSDGKLIPDVVYRTYEKNYEPIQLYESFAWSFTLDWCYDGMHEDIFRKWYC